MFYWAAAVSGEGRGSLSDGAERGPTIAGGVGVRSRAVRIFIVGAGLVGARIVSALHAEHELTVVDLEPARLRPLAQRYDVATARASASSGRQLLSAGIADAELVIACTSRDDANLVAGSFARSVARGAKTIVRTSSAEFVEVWQEGRLDVDCVVSDQLETARAVSAAVGMPAARHTDTFAEGRIQVLELDVPAAAGAQLVNQKLRSARLPGESRIAGVIRDEKTVLVRGDTEIAPGDRVVVDRVAGGGSRLVPAGRAADGRGHGRRRLRGARAGRGDRPFAVPAGARGARDRARRGPCGVARRAAAGGARLPHRRAGSRVPQARGDRSRAGGDLRDARRPAQPVRRRARAARGRPVPDRARAHADLGADLRARGDRRHDRSAARHVRGDHALRPRSAHSPDGDARARPVHGARPHDAPGQRVRRRSDARAAQRAAR